MLQLVGPRLSNYGKSLLFCPNQVSTLYPNIFDFPSTTHVNQENYLPRRRRTGGSGGPPQPPPTMFIACNNVPWVPHFSFWHTTTPHPPHSVVVPRTPNRLASALLALLEFPRTPRVTVVLPSCLLPHWRIQRDSRRPRRHTDNALPLPTRRLYAWRSPRRHPQGTALWRSSPRHSHALQQFRQTPRPNGWCTVSATATAEFPHQDSPGRLQKSFGRIPRHVP